MKIGARQEILARMVSVATTRGIRRVVRLWDTKSPLLIWGAFDDDNGGGCVYTWLGRYHPKARSVRYPGPEFMALMGMRESYVMDEWDKNENFRAELIVALRRELLYRRGATGERTRATHGRSTDRRPRPVPDHGRRGVLVDALPRQQAAGPKVERGHG
jgi:hypothetical protein